MLQPSDRDTIAKITTLVKQGSYWREIPLALRKEYDRIVVTHERTHLHAEIQTLLSRLHRLFHRGNHR